MYDTLFHIVIMLSQLILGMFIYIFPLLSIIVNFYLLFGKMSHISEKV